jgi:hypothetical protein
LVLSDIGVVKSSIHRSVVRRKQFENRPNKSGHYVMKSASAGLQKSGPHTAGTQARAGIVLQKLALIIQNDGQPTIAAGFFRPIDTARIARDFKIEAIARDRGRHDLPETRDNSLDALEQKLIQKAEVEWGCQGNELLNSLKAYAAQLVSYSIPGEFLRLQIQAEHLLAWLRVAAGQALRDLTPLQERYVGARDELEEFGKRNQLSRPARESSQRWTILGLLLIMVAMESLLNGFFFVRGSEFDLVREVGATIGISLTNVALSFLIGLGPLRWRNYRYVLSSALGLIITFAGIAFTVALHLFAARLWMVIAVVGEDQFFVTPVGAIQEAPWALPGIASFYFIGMGLIFTFGAIWKGYSFDDPYPRYGATYRRKKSALEAYTKAHFALFSELSEVKEDTVVQLNDGITTLPKFRQRAIDVRAERAAMLNSFRAYENSLEIAINQLLKLYRDINHAQRTTAPPSYFDEKWQLPHSLLMLPELKPLLADPEVGDVASRLTELERLSAAIIRRYDLLHERYPHPSEVD